MKWTRIAAFFALLALVPNLGLAGNTLQQRINAERAKSRQIHAKLARKRAQLHAATLHENDLRTQLQEADSAIASVRARIGGLDAQARSTQRRLSWNTRQLDAAQRSLNLHAHALDKRLVDIYENGNLSYVAVLLSAHSFTQFVERWQDLRLLIAANERALRERKAAQARVAAVQADLERTRLALQTQQLAQTRAQNQLATLADERRNLVAVADSNRRATARVVKQMEELSAAQELQLEALIRERAAAIAAEREAQQRAAGITGNVGQPSGSGSFSWPVTGTITSPFGWRANPFGGAPDFHTGLDIAAPTGTTITAAASGTVMLAQWYGGYGNYILLDNGGSYSTGYGHLSAIYVSVGQKVKRGQAIGAVGMTGLATGPHLHFEIRIDGKPVDPAPRLH